MWYVLIIFMLGVAVTYIVAITLEKVFYRMGKTKTTQKKKKKSTYMTRRERMRSYNKRN